MSVLERNLFNALDACTKVQGQLIRCLQKAQDKPGSLHAGEACPIEDLVQVFSEALEALRKNPLWLDDEDSEDPN